jgi:hypothetical protein
VVRIILDSRVGVVAVGDDPRVRKRLGEKIAEPECIIFCRPWLVAMSGWSMDSDNAISTADGQLICHPILKNPMHSTTGSTPGTSTWIPK